MASHASSFVTRRGPMSRLRLGRMVVLRRMGRRDSAFIEAVRLVAGEPLITGGC